MILSVGDKFRVIEGLSLRLQSREGGANRRKQEEVFLAANRSFRRIAVSLQSSRSYAS